MDIGSNDKIIDKMLYANKTEIILNRDSQITFGS
jgi:hypothetical protein